MDPPLSIVFMGTASLACPSLKALCGQPVDFTVAAVVTQPDRPKGRDLRKQASPVKDLAQRFKLPVLQPERAKDPAFLNELRQFEPELIVVAAYGQILPQALLDLPRLGCLNVHASLLPKYRGAAPVQWAVFNGDRETGVTIMKMDAGLDTGGIVAQAKTAISAPDTAQTLHDRLAQMGADLLVKVIPRYAKGQIIPQPQPAEGASYAEKISREDGRIKWSWTAQQIVNQIRAFQPWPGAFAHLAVGSEQKLIKIWGATIVPGSRGSPGEIVFADRNGLVVACGEDALRLETIQEEGGRRMTAQEFMAGRRLQPGQRFEQ